ncbi:hypothetical protein E1A91_D01G054900v1 [Gossypium mustelinum]|uniref:Cytochrome b561 and DOMON domain-containing protein n=2 Tax=Gossypium TaxID=3633 RepID=A0A5D2W3I7_GOSMU|nr:hypothetical protein ES332_D01G056000v1 [Gossypium tomentosum]TYI96205.1 hypothetical protein E1A91_D01G054900v1 [Gossypium mustelinum]
MASKSFSFAFLLLFFLCTFAAAEPCDNHRFRGGKTFASCIDLPSLNCSLHWNFHSLTQTVDVALRRNSVDQKTRWMSWAINPHSKGMVGSHALVAFQKDDGTMVAYTSPITSYATQLQKGDLSFPVNGVSSILEGNEMIMFATLALPANTTTVNHLWQEGPLVGNVPRMHRKLVVDKTSSRNQWKIVHGILCTLGLGFLMPVGALIARHGKQWPGTAWFRAHVFSQCSAYLIGLAGGIIARIGGGIHQYIGITLLGLGAIQGIVGYCRPHKEDKKRVYFNIFHCSLGYGTIGLSIANVFLGFHMVHLMIKTWPQVTYIAAISLLGTITLILEGVGCWRRTTKGKLIALLTLMQEDRDGHIIARPL